MLAQKNYKRCHDKVCSHLHLFLSSKYGLDVDSKWYHYKPENVIENDIVKILWDYNLTSKLTGLLRTADITIADKPRRKCLIVACSHTRRPKYHKERIWEDQFYWTESTNKVHVSTLQKSAPLCTANVLQKVCLSVCLSEVIDLTESAIVIITSISTDRLYPTTSPLIRGWFQVDQALLVTIFLKNCSLSQR